MSSRTRIQTYLKRNRVSELFEEMMSKLIQDLPSEPVEYLVQLLQKRISVGQKKVILKEQSTRPFTATQSSPSAKLWSSEGKPQRSKSEKLSATMPVTETDGESRHYSKPWLTNSKKQSQIKDKARPGLSQSMPASSKPDWDGRTRVPLQQTDGKIPQAAMEAEDDVDLRLVYTSPKVFGKPLEGSNAEVSELECKDSSIDSKKSKKYAKPLKPSEAKRKRRQKIRDSVKDEKSKKTDDPGQAASDDDDALELYEDVNDLYDEGVKNPPKTGVYTSGNISHRKEEIELVLNMSRFFDSLGGAVSVASHNGKPKSEVLLDNDDYFESASQVTGPRHPVWEAPGSDVDSEPAFPARRVNAAMFDVRSATSKQKSEDARSHSSRKGNAAQRSVETTPKRPSSQLSAHSQKGTDEKPRNVPGTTSRPQSASGSRKEKSSRRSSKDVAERPKTAQS